jgi:hypothetical protein
MWSNWSKLGAYPHADPFDKPLGSGHLPDNSHPPIIYPILSGLAPALRRAARL